MPGLAVAIGLPLVGIDLTALSVFGGALGVGLGFGMQKIAANYVSGFILLLDRSIRMGNLISVGNERGGGEMRLKIGKAADPHQADPLSGEWRDRNLLRR